MTKANVLAAMAALSIATAGLTMSAGFSLAGEGGSGMGGGGYGQPTQSQRPGDTNAGPARRVAGPIRNEIQKPLAEATDLVSRKDYQGALAKIREADAITGKTPYEEYQVAKYFGNVYIQLQDYANATTAYNRAVASDATPTQELPQVLKVAMLLNYQAKEYAKVINYGAQLAALGPLDEKSSAVLAAAYFSTSDFASALKIARAAVDAITASGGRPGEEILSSLMLAQARTGDAAGARQTLEQLCLVTKQPIYWAEIIDTEAMHAGLSEHQLLNLYRLRFLAGAMQSGQEYVVMANAALKSGFPNEARDVLEKGLTSGGVSRALAQEFLTQANAQAPSLEHSLASFDHEARASATGAKDAILGETYWSFGRYPEAQEALERGIAKGGLKDAAETQLILGIVLLSEGKKDEAVQAFDKAAASPGQAAIAHVWSIYAKRTV